MPCGTCSARMYGEGGVRSSLFATSVIGIFERSAARYRMSLITAGQASASTQMCTCYLENRKQKKKKPPEGGFQG